MGDYAPDLTPAEREEYEAYLDQLYDDEEEFWARVRFAEEIDYQIRIAISLPHDDKHKDAVKFLNRFGVAA